MSTTAADAARRAAGWAARAEDAHKQAEARRGRAHELESQRLSAAARGWREQADDAEAQRVTAVAMATMWAAVTGALQGVELGRRP
ncbi:hypothetical protein [Streptomyces sp. NPDC047315]|uniref:hypothetical protein n=1 Tax=Streptomyces sp. NPDC047315 TaxID=3155142 RepID=UPI0033EE3BFE